jgi:hypothetical protein
VLIDEVRVFGDLLADEPAEGLQARFSPVQVGLGVRAFDLGPQHGVMVPEVQVPPAIEPGVIKGHEPW